MPSSYDVKQADQRIAKTYDDHSIDIMHFSPMQVGVIVGVSGIDKEQREVSQMKHNES